MDFNTFQSQENQILALVQDLEKSILSILEKKSQVVIAVSGGKSPIGLFEQLNKLDLPWDKVIITLVDERIVDTNHEDSNENLVKTHLLKHYAQKANFNGLVDMAKPVAEMVNIANEQIPDIDIAILGMGEDGHTASIFPCCKELDSALSLENQSKYINTNPISAKYSRISLTLNALGNIPSLFLSISGETKLKVLNESLKIKNKNYPISYLLNLRKDLTVHYYE